MVDLTYHRSSGLMEALNRRVYLERSGHSVILELAMVRSAAIRALRMMVSFIDLYSKPHP